MKNQHTHEMKPLRKKLFAAIAMLLVACVMTISSTYAWFTLSTAPEVKGITTTVGANGNLEIALGTYNTVYAGGIPGSGEGTSMDKAGVTKDVANVTWGNLIDVTGLYGLESIALFPTRLNASAGLVANAAPLKYAKYGADGRVTELAGAIKGAWGGSSFMYDVANKPAGVNGIGSSSAISERALALMGYKNNFVRYQNAAKTAAENSIVLYGADLAGLMIDGGVADSNDYFSYKPYLQGLIDELKTSNAAVGNAVKSAILAFLASAKAQNADNTALTDEAWKNLDTVAAAQTVEDLITTIGAAYNVPVEYIDTYFTDIYVGIRDKLNTAQENLDAMTETNADWTAVNAVVVDLVDTDRLLVMGETIPEIKADPDNIINKMMQGTGLDVSFGYTEGKVYSDLADMVGEFSGTITFKQGTVINAMGQNVNLGGDGADLKPVSTDLKVLARATGFAGMLSTIKTDVVNYPQTTAGTDQQGLTNLYGYSLDLLFRTNAADSKLLLQVAPENRIYAENDNEAIMGGGSNMTFTTSAGMTADRVKALMGAIRVVFYATPEVEGSGEILAVAKLDTANATTAGNDVKANLQLVDLETAYNADGVFNTAAAAVTADANGNYELTALSANTIKRVTALVYLDGDVVDNSMVSAYADIAGMLNLQFSSTANLKPMDYQNLKDGVTA